jgi:hypothetical protein
MNAPSRFALIIFITSLIFKVIIILGSGPFTRVVGSFLSKVKEKATRDWPLVFFDVFL